MLDTLGQRLQFALDKAETTQLALADFMGVSSSAVNQWIKDISKPKRPERIEEFFETLDIDFCVTPWWLFNGGELPERAKKGEPFDVNKYVIVPSIDIKACCGNGYALEFEEVRGGLAFNKEWVSRMGLDGHNLEVIKASGKSMEPTIFDGNMLLVDRSDTTISPSMAKIYVVGYGGDIMIKRVRIEGDAIILESDNNNKRDYHTITIKQSPTNQLAETFRIIGRIIWQSGTL